MSTPPLCPLCDEHDCDCVNTPPATALPVPESPDEQVIHQLTLLFSVALDGFLERHSDGVSYTDLLNALRNVFVQVASVCSIERLPEEPMAAYVNHVAVLQLLDKMREHVAG